MNPTGKAMKPYDEFETFRALAKRAPRPQRYEALDDLHRTLYGTLHPSAERIGREDTVEEDRELAGEGEGGTGDWLEENGPLVAAIGLVGIALVYAIATKKTISPLQGPPANPHPPTPAQPTP